MKVASAVVERARLVQNVLESGQQSVEVRDGRREESRCETACKPIAFASSSPPFTALQKLPVTKIVDNLMECRSSPETDDYRYFDPKLLRSADR